MLERDLRSSLLARQSVAPDIVMLVGRPGVGKYTVGRRLAAATGYRLLHNHAVVDLASSLFDFGTPEFVALREQLWLTVIAASLDGPVPGLIVTFAPERTVSDSFLPALAALASSREARLRWIELHCADVTIEQRLGDESRSAFGKLRDVVLYRQLVADGVFERPVMPSPERRISTELQSAAKAAAEIATHLGFGPVPNS